MEHIFTIAALWLGLAVISAIIAYHLRISIALIEICVGVLTAAVAGYLGLMDALGSNLEWLRFLAASGAVLLTFLAGAELEPEVLRKQTERSDGRWSGRFLCPLFGVCGYCPLWVGLEPCRPVCFAAWPFRPPRWRLFTR